MGDSAPAVAIEGLSVVAGGRTLLAGVDLAVAGGEALALVGPSGAGKTTLLRCVNRLVDLLPGLRASGQVRIGGEPIFRRGVDLDRLRSRVGMLFQQPVVFPGSVLANAVFGLAHARRLPRRRWAEAAQRALVSAGLWEEVRDRLREPAASLSVGQQQRLCLARALALEPEVLLLDEPTASLDPRSAAAIEALVTASKGTRTVILVSHDLALAGRVADRIACLLPAEGGARLAEVAPAAGFFSGRRSPEVAAFLVGGPAPTTLEVLAR